MKFVYVLVSSENDYYYEQCYISINSLLRNNPDAEIVLLVDNITNISLVNYRGLIKELITKLVVITFSDSVTPIVRSRMLKTSLCNYVDGNFLYIDIDTVIVENLDSIKEENVDIGMVLDQHSLISEHYRYMYMSKNARKMHYSVGYDDRHFNSGVMLIRNTNRTKKFFELWNKLYTDTSKKGLYIDQLSMNEANVRLSGVIKEIGGIWNVQINCGMKFISQSKIIHYLGYQPLNKQNIYFNSLPFELCNDSYFVEMKNKKSITENINRIINNPKNEFKTVSIIPNDCIAYELIFSNHMRILKWLYVRLNRVYCVMERVYGRLFYIIYKRG